jgi:hypothetical protein
MLDPVLRDFVDADSDEAAERQLESLLEKRIGPLLRRVVAGKLRAHGALKVVAVEDLEDVAGDAGLVLLKRLQALRQRPDAEDIESLDDYTAAVAYSACAHYLRRRHPERSRLKSRLRYVFGRDRRFAMWDVPAIGLCCGLARWRGHGLDQAAAAALAELERDSRHWPEAWASPAVVDRADPVPVLLEILHRVGGAVEFDRVVSLLASIWRIGSVVQRDPDSLVDRLAGDTPTPELSIDRRRFAERLWTEIQQLPVRQRVALLLNLRQGQGAGLLWVFAALGIASVRAIAATLEMPFDDLAALWSRLPLDDNTVADRLGCTRQQVINLRMSARKRLNNRLGTAEWHSLAKTNRPVMSRPLPRPWESTSD